MDEPVEKPTKEPAQKIKETEDNLSEAPEAPKEKQFSKKKEKQGKGQSQQDAEKQVKKIQDKDFNYIVRVANTDINGEHSVVQGLTQIKGIGRHMAVFVADAAGLDRTLKFGKLNEAQITKIKEVLEQINTLVPNWMLNRRRDGYTGQSYHLISMDVDARLRDDINMMKMIRSYKGVRHEIGLKVRGQRSSSNGRKGLALGVSKRREAPAAAASEKGGKEEKKKE